MRTYTLVASILVHAAVFATLIVVPLVAIDVLPDLPRATTFLIVKAEPLPKLRRAAPVRTSTPVPDPAVAPVVEPDGFQPETVIEPAGDPPGETVPGGDGGIGDPLVGVAVVPTPTAPAPPALPVPVRVGGAIRPPQRIHYVAPVYPPIALSARVSGVVILEALIAENGVVKDVKVLRSEGLLDQAAASAVRQWRFTPTLLNGEPVAVLMTVTVSFSLS